MNKSCYLLFAIALLLLSRRDAAAFDYADALDKAILFFEAQRSGKLLVGQRVAWRANSGLSDGSADHVDLVGGYYDAGDNVKFGFPMAFTVTMLAWGVIEFGDTMPRGQLNNANAAVRWGADYLIRAATAKPDTLYVQVAEPNQDHRCWERPEDMDTPRNVYKVTAQNPGSDVAGETSAALAASSLVFRNSDRAYAGKLLKTAQKVFKFADQHRGAYSDSLGSVVCPFYCSYSGYRDELLWAASWLHVASRGSTGEYLSYINDNGGAFGGADDSFTFSWDDKRPATKLLLSKVFLESKNNALKQYKEGADRYICSLVPEAPGFQSQYTPGGLLYKEGASNMQYVTATTFLLVTYAKYLNANSASSSCGVTTSTIISLAKKQVDYILGANPAGMSYMVGFGLRYPRHVHHRGASEPSVHVHPGHISCEEGFQYLHTNTPDTNVIVGALVGGPDNSDKFTDSRDNYQQTEPTTYTNAPLVGALAFFAGQAQVKQRLHS